MKKFWRRLKLFVLLLVIVAAGFGWEEWRIKNLKIEVKLHQAVSLTGPLGDTKFVALDDGSYVIAGQHVTQKQFDLIRYTDEGGCFRVFMLEDSRPDLALIMERPEGCATGSERRPRQVTSRKR